MKWWKKLCAAALALSMPVLASAEAKLVDTQTFARSITLGRASDTYVTREDWRDTLRAMDGTALSESYADISAQEKGLYYEVANENGVNQTGLMDAAGTLLIPMTYSDFTYVGNGWVVAVTLEETTDEKSDYRAMFGGGHYNVARGDIYYGAQKMAEMNREETTGASMEVYGAYLFVRLDKSSGFYLKTDGTRTEFNGESFSRGEYEEIYKQGVYHHPTAQFAFVPECALTADEVSRSVWYDTKTGNFLDLQGNVLREAVQDGKPLYDSVRYYGGDYMLTKKDRLSGIVDMTGQEIVPPMYDTLGGDYAGLLFEGGYQAALEGGKLRFLNRDGQVSASVDYELKENDWKGLTNNAPMIYAEMNGKISVFTATRGELPTQYEEAARGQAGQELLAVKQDGLWGCIGMDGEVVVPFVMKYAPEISFDGRYVVGSTAEGYQLFTISYGE